MNPRAKSPKSTRKWEKLTRTRVIIGSGFRERWGRVKKWWKSILQWIGFEKNFEKDLTFGKKCGKIYIHWGALALMRCWCTMLMFVHRGPGQGDVMYIKLHEYCMHQHLNRPPLWKTILQWIGFEKCQWKPLDFFRLLWYNIITNVANAEGPARL
jgi:hypothetical protein